MYQLEYQSSIAYNCRYTASLIGTKLLDQLQSEANWQRHWRAIDATSLFVLDAVDGWVIVARAIAAWLTSEAPSNFVFEPVGLLPAAEWPSCPAHPLPLSNSTVNPGLTAQLDKQHAPKSQTKYEGATAMDLDFDLPLEQAAQKLIDSLTKTDALSAKYTTDLGIRDLRAKCKAAGIKGASRFTKAQCLGALAQVG